MGSKSPDTTKSSQITADATKEAAKLQAQSEAENRALQEKLYNSQLNYTKDQDEYNKGVVIKNQAQWSPYIETGQAANKLVMGQLLDPNGWLNKSFTKADLAQDDGYQFRLQQGQDALNSSLAAKGGLLSGEAVKASNDYAQGMASDEYNNAYSRFTNDKNNRYSVLSGLLNQGMQAASGYQGGSPQSTTGTQLSNISANYGNTLGNIISNGANNQSNLIMGNAAQQAQLAMASQQKSGGALGGALAGAAAGSSFGPWGAVGGAVLGGLGSLL